MNDWRRFWRGVALWTLALFLPVLALTIYIAVFERTDLGVGDRVTMVVDTVPAHLAFVLPAGVFAAAFSSAPELLQGTRLSRAGLLRFLGAAAMLTLGCLLLVSYVSPAALQQAGSGHPFGTYLHEMPGEWRADLDRAAAEDASDRERGALRSSAAMTQWYFVFRFVWSGLAGLALVLGFLVGYWARRVRDPRLVAFQGWAAGLLLLATVVSCAVVGFGLARFPPYRVGLGIGMVPAIPVFVTLALAWPTWLSTRGRHLLQTASTGEPARGP